MFFDAERIAAVRQMILASTPDGRRAALAKILPMQRQDFISLFEIMAGLPVTIRLLDPPLHEFLPADDEVEQVARAIGADPAALAARVAELREFNPMLGHRGVRLAISYPEIADMQARAIFEAVVEVARRTGTPPIPEVMIPLIATRAEYDVVAERIAVVCREVEASSGTSIHYLCGTMIELPRACLRAAEIAGSAEFFSFGTNDLTQTCFGISRDDSARFLGEYTAKGILPQDPFISIDQEGVGELVRMGVERGRSARTDLKLGICGEHGGDPASIRFCHEVGLDYVSCSPYRVPIARLAAAQAVLKRDE
jgi:pyruvate, orthophosphate dikinase